MLSLCAAAAVRLAAVKQAIACRVTTANCEPMSNTAPFSVSTFLRAQEALLVHFNTPMSTKHPTAFPNDLIVAKGLAGRRLSFATIQKNDRGPWQGGNPADANAAGSVGLVVDIKDASSVVSVDWTDSGSNGLGSLGHTPDAQNCADSIAKRTSSNEWWVQDYIPIGIFLFLPARVFVKQNGQQGEVPVDFPAILAAYPDDRIYSVFNGSFVEYDRGADRWLPTTYDQIVPA